MDLFFYASTDFVGLFIFDDEQKETLNLRAVKGTESASQVVAAQTNIFPFLSKFPLAHYCSGSL